MTLNLTERGPTGTIHLRPWAIPLVIAALVMPIVGSIVVGIVGGVGAGIGLAAGFAAVLALTVYAVRAGPDGPIAVAPRRDAELRVLVVAAAEITPEAASRVAEIAGAADDVRLIVPVAGRQIDRWTSATDSAREEAQDGLARAAGVLVAAGLPVSGSLGDRDPGQALEDELAGYPADRVVMVTEPGAADIPLATEQRLGLPLDRVRAG